MGLRPRQRLYPKELGSMRLHDPITKWPLFGQIWRLGGANHITGILDVSRVLGARIQGPWLGRGSQGGRRELFIQGVAGAMGSRVSKRGGGWAANLPTCLWKTGDLHPEHGAAWARSNRAVRWSTGEVLLAARTTSKLHGQSLTFEITAICDGR